MSNAKRGRQKHVSNAGGERKSGLLSEGLVKAALENLAWADLKEHLAEVGIDDSKLESLIGQILRTSSLILPYPNPVREESRNRFFQDLTGYIERESGKEAAEQVVGLQALLHRIEQGYRGILALLDSSEYAKLLPPERITACLGRGGKQYADIVKTFQQTVKGRREYILTSGPILTGFDSAPVSPDAVLTSLVDATTMVLQMEAIKNGWLDLRGRVVLPPLPAENEEDFVKAESTEELALSWRLWRRIEQRCRFLGGSLDRFVGDDRPGWVPTRFDEFTMSQPSETELSDWVANERFNDRVVQRLMDMTSEFNSDEQPRDPSSVVPLAPDGFISTRERYDSAALIDLISYDIFEDRDTVAGLRFVEWLRGYSVLCELADTQQGKGVIFSVSRDVLLEECCTVGLRHEAAQTFIDRVTLTRASRDLFDCPLIAMKDDSFIVFGPGVLRANHARIILSNIAHHRASLDRKGKAFEREMIRVFRCQGLRAESFKVNREGEEFEYDVVVEWGSYIFVLECKNHGLSHHDPVDAYYFGLEQASSVRQVKRLASNLYRHPDVLRDCMGIDASEKVIIPCVVNAMPYSLQGDTDGVFVTDASSVRRFFEDRYLHIKKAHRLDENVSLIHRIPIYEMWSGESPAVEDFIRHLREPVQVRLMLAHLDIRELAFKAGESHLVVARLFGRQETTLDSIGKFAGKSPDAVRKELANVSNEMGRIRRIANRDASSK